MFCVCLCLSVCTNSEVRIHAWMLMSTNKSSLLLDKVNFYVLMSWALVCSHLTLRYWTSKKCFEEHEVKVKVVCAKVLVYMCMRGYKLQCVDMNTVSVTCKLFKFFTCMYSIFECMWYLLYVTLPLILHF